MLGMKLEPLDRPKRDDLRQFPQKQIFLGVWNRHSHSGVRSSSLTRRLRHRYAPQDVMCITFRRPIKTENWARETGGYVRPEADSCQHLYDIAVEVNFFGLAGLKRRALELSSSKKLPVSLFAATQVATHPSISSSDDQDMRGRVRCGLPNAC